MSPYTAYFLGILTVLLIIVPFWVLSLFVTSIKTAYTNSVCYKICPSGTST